MKISQKPNKSSQPKKKGTTQKERETKKTSAHAQKKILMILNVPRGK